MNTGIHVGGSFDVTCYRMDGSLVWQERVGNIVTNEGLAHILNVVLHGTTQIGTWYMAIVESNTTPGSAMTYASPSFTESTAYDEANRIVYNEAAASGGSITNVANKGTFTISATKTIYGAAILGGGTAASTKGDTAGGGVLLCYAQFGSSQAVQDGYVLDCTYTFSAVDD